MILGKLLDIVEANTKIVIDESQTKVWQVIGNKTIIKDKSLQEILHKDTKKYEDYEVIGIEVLNNTLHIAIFK